MNADTLLLRQAHADFLQNGELTSQVFFPFPKDEGQLSVYDGDQIQPENSFEHYTQNLGFSSAGVWGVTCGEVGNIGDLASSPDPLPENPAHALIVFPGSEDKMNRKLAKKLKAIATVRGCLYRP